MTTKYKVTKSWLDRKSGNVWYCGEYDKESLPAKLLEDKRICIPIENIVGDTVTVIKPNETVFNETTELNKTISQIENNYKINDPEYVVNINEASVDELIRIDGIGKATANKIIVGRPYLDIKDLAKVTNIDRLNLGQLKV
jgi:hypothetical protein